MLKKFLKNLLNKPFRVYFVAAINDKEFTFNSKSELLRFVESYSLQNTIYAFAMFKFKVYLIQK